MQPVELSRSQPGAQQLVLTLYLHPSLFWFRGHFARQPLLPGVAQVDLAIRHASAVLAPGYLFAGIEQVKFQHPLTPHSTIKLALHWREARQLLTFNCLLCTKTGERLASSGKIKLYKDVSNHAE